MTNPESGRLLDRVRKLLAQAEDDAVTQAEAEAFTVKAAELMAKYGIDRALLETKVPGLSKPADRKIDIDSPWAREKGYLLSALARALRCQPIVTAERVSGQRVHVFGFASDIERLDILYTSVLLQMASALRRAEPPGWLEGQRVRAWRRSWLLGYVSAVGVRVTQAETQAATQAASSGTGAELVLADRSLAVKAAVRETYPQLRKARVTYSGNGYGDGFAKGRQANIGGNAGVGRSAAGAISR